MGPWTPESRRWGRERGGCIIRKGGQDEAGEGQRPAVHSLMVPGKDSGSSSRSHGKPWRGFKQESGRVTSAVYF